MVCLCTVSAPLLICYPLLNHQSPRSVDCKARSLTLYGRVMPSAVAAHSAPAFHAFRDSMSRTQCLKGGNALLPAVITVVTMLVLFHIGQPAIWTMHDVPSAARAPPTSQRTLRVTAWPRAPVTQRTHALRAPHVRASVHTGSAVPMGHARAGPHNAPSEPHYISVAMTKAHRMSWLPVCVLGAWLALAAGCLMYSCTRTWVRVLDAGHCVYGAMIGVANMAASSTWQGPPTARFVEMSEDGGKQWPPWPPLALAAVTGVQTFKSRRT